MKKHFSNQDRLQASKDSVKGNGSWLWMVAALFSGFIVSVPLGYILFGNHMNQVARACMYQLGGALGLAENSLFRKLGIGPGPLEMRFAKLVFEEHQVALWCVLIAQVAGMVIYLLFFSGQNVPIPRQIEQIPHPGKENVIIIPCQELWREKSQKISSDFFDLRNSCQNPPCPDLSRQMVSREKIPWLIGLSTFYNFS